MQIVEDRPYRDAMNDLFKRMGCNPGFYQNHTPVRVMGQVKRITRRERELVDSLSKERGYRRFNAFGRTI